MNAWNNRLLPPAAPDESLSVQLEHLLEQQRSTWELFRNGEAALDSVTTKQYTLNSSDIIVQSNPGRAISTNAKVDPASIAQRPCFLCPASLPPQERGISFGRYIIMPNPFPILKNHVTIAFEKHLPQKLGGRTADLSALAEALGPDMFVLYNGPRCGASAPDHMHFQACCAQGVPLFEEFSCTADDNRFSARSLWGRNLLCGSFSGRKKAAVALQQALASLSSVTAGKDEPMLNIIIRSSGSRLHVALFPRAKHRSACYFAPPDERLSISPAAVEMAGIVVVADPGHFDRTTGDAVYAMYREVTLDDTLFSQVAKELE